MDIVRPADFSVDMANPTTAPVLGVTNAINVMITSGAAGPLRFGWNGVRSSTWNQRSFTARSLL